MFERRLMKLMLNGSTSAHSITEETADTDDEGVESYGQERHQVEEAFVPSSLLEFNRRLPTSSVFYLTLYKGSMAKDTQVDAIQLTTKPHGSLAGPDRAFGQQSDRHLQPWSPMR